MARNTVTLRYFVLALLALLVPARATRAQSADDFFDSRTLQEVRLFINSRDLGLLRRNYTANAYYPADFIWRGVRMRNVAVRVRGLASRSAEKPGLRIDFNRYVDGQAFLGLRSIVLDNVLKDPAFIRERTSMALIERMGQPAPRESFARVYINEQYQGVYALVEAVNEDFLERTISEHSGYLFDFTWISGFFAEDLGDDLGAYRARFEPETHRLEPDSVLFAPIRNLFLEANHEVDGAWRDRVDQYIDLAQLVTHVAIETCLAETDGFVGSAGMANFYLYRPADATRHRLFAWDRDTTFQEFDSPIFARIDQNVLFWRAMGFSDLRSRYLDVLEQCARTASEDHWLEAEVIRAGDLIRASVYEDTSKIFSNEDYDAGIAFLLEFAKRRPAFVLAEIEKARGAAAR